MSKGGKVPYKGHPILALIVGHIILRLRTLLAIFANVGVATPIIFMLLGPGVSGEDKGLLSPMAALIACTVVFVVADTLMLVFWNVEKPVEIYGTHKLIFFNIYECLVFIVNLGAIAYLFYEHSDEAFFVALFTGLLFPMIPAQISFIRGINREACSKCRRANMMITNYAGSTYRYEADYKTVGGYDTKVGELRYEGEKIDVMGHVPRQKVFDGVSKVTTDKTNCVCPVCGYRKTLYDSYRKKIY